MLVPYQGTLAEFAALCGVPYSGQDRPICSLSTDSREIGKNTLFCALKGEKADGDQFVLSAFENGAVAALCSDAREVTSFPLLRTRDVFSALIRAANAKTEKIDPKKIAVTGSVGKTTTKELIASILSLGKKVTKSGGNFNTRTGMVLTMLSMPSETEVLICEMGMSARFEIAEMSRILRPDIAVITNVGTAHLESLGTRENIALAKCEILEGMSSTGILVYNGDEPLLREKADRYPTSVSFGFGEQNDVRVAECRFEKRRTDFDLIRGGEISNGFCLPLPGKNHLADALAAYAAARLAGADDALCRLGMLSYSPVGKRSNEVEKRGMHIIEDYYNAGPESMAASLDNLVLLAGDGRKIAVLGDMLELGEKSDFLHMEIGKRVFGCGIDILITVGEKAAKLADAARKAGMENVFSFNESKDALACLLEKGREGDTVLIKASHGMHFEEIAEAI